MPTPIAFNVCLIAIVWILCAVQPAALQAATVAAKNDTTAGESFELIILHNNDMHARFEQTDAMSKLCNNEDVLHNRCYGGFARVVYKWVFLKLCFRLSSYM